MKNEVENPIEMEKIMEGMSPGDEKEAEEKKDEKPAEEDDIEGLAAATQGSGDKICITCVLSAANGTGNLHRISHNTNMKNPRETADGPSFGCEIQHSGIHDIPF